MPEILKESDQVISKETAYQITSMLEGVIKRGTGKNLKILIYQLLEKQGQQMIILMHGLLGQLQI